MNTTFKQSFTPSALRMDRWQVSIPVACTLMLIATYFRIGYPVPFTLQTLAFAWITVQLGPRTALAATLTSFICFFHPRPTMIIYFGFIMAIPIWSMVRSSHIQWRLPLLIAGLAPIFSILYFLTPSIHLFFYFLAIDVVKMTLVFFFIRKASS